MSNLATKLPAAPTRLTDKIMVGSSYVRKTIGVWDWSEQDITQLKALWANGQTFTQIAKVTGRTRSAIAGKIHRLNHALPGVATRGNSKKVVAKPKTVRPPKIAKPEKLVKSKRLIRALNFGAIPTAETEIMRDIVEERGGTPVLTVREFQCRWPMARNEQGQPMCCGAPVIFGSYCTQHAPRVYVSVKRRLAEAAEADAA